MYGVIAYDVGVERVNKVRIFLKQYLNWVQNSLFEGDLTKAELMRIQNGLKKLVDKENDYVKIFLVRDESLLKVKEVGTPKVELGKII